MVTRLYSEEQHEVGLDLHRIKGAEVLLFHCKTRMHLI